MSKAFLYQLKENEKSKINIESSIPHNFDPSYKSYKIINYSDNDHDSTKNIIPFIKSENNFSNVYSFMNIPKNNIPNHIHLGKEFCLDKYYSIDKVVPVYLNSLPDSYYHFNMKDQSYEKMRLDRLKNQEGIDTVTSKLLENEEVKIAMDQLDQDKESFVYNSNIVLDELRKSMEIRPAFEKIEEKVEINISKKKRERDFQKTDDDIEMEIEENKKDIQSIKNMMNNKLFKDSSVAKTEKTEKTENIEKGEETEEEPSKSSVNMKLFSNDNDMTGLSDLEIAFKTDFIEYMNNYVTKDDQKHIRSRIKQGGSSVYFNKRDANIRVYVNRLLRNIEQKNNRDAAKRRLFLEREDEKKIGSLDMRFYEDDVTKSNPSFLQLNKYSSDDENTRLY